MTSRVSPVARHMEQPVDPTDPIAPSIEPNNAPSIAPSIAPSRVAPAEPAVPLEPAAAPLRRAVDIGRRRRLAFAAVAVSAVCAIAAGAAVIAMLQRPVSTTVEVRIVEMPRPDPRPSTCGVPFLQYAVVRNYATSAIDIVDPFGSLVHVQCLPGGPGGDIASARSSGPDRLFGTHDDTCWSGPTTWSCRDLAAEERAVLERLARRLPHKSPSHDMQHRHLQTHPKKRLDDAPVTKAARGQQP